MYRKHFIRTVLIETFIVKRSTFYCCKQLYNPRANGAKRRSGRKPGARVTNFVLAELKVVARDR